MHENRLEMTMSTILRSILSVSGVNIPLTVVTAWSLRQRGKGTGTLRWGETWEEEEEELLRSARRLTGIRGLSVNNREVTFGPHDDTVLTSHPLLCSALHVCRILMLQRPVFSSPRACVIWKRNGSISRTIKTIRPSGRLSVMTSLIYSGHLGTRHWPWAWNRTHNLYLCIHQHVKRVFV